MTELSASAIEPADQVAAQNPGPQVPGPQVPGPQGAASDQAIADHAVAAAERIAFLALASELARGRKVLVVDDGASALAGIAAHLDSTSIGDIATIEPGSYDLVVADLRAADQATAEGIAQLARVVGADAGTALVRLPKRPEFAPLAEQLAGNFARILTLRQHNWVSSALFDDAMFGNDDPSRAVAASVRKMAAAAKGEQLYDVILASHGAFPDFRPQLALTRSPQLRQALQDLAAEQQLRERERAQAAARELAQDSRIRELEEELAWYDEHYLALRESIERSGFKSSLLRLWVKFSENRIRLQRFLSK